MVNYICWSKDEENLSRSASGGIMYELAKYFILKKKGAVVGVTKDGYFDIAFNLDTVQKFQGSKYWFPFGLPTVIRSLHRINDIPVLFVGTPCQVEQVRRALPRHKNIFYVNLKCHGFYSTAGVERNGEHKNNGWSKSWHHLPKDYLDCSSLRRGCKNCKLEFKGDIEISDAWDAPKHQINEYGTSRVTPITLRGEKVFKELDIHKEIEGAVQHRPHRIALLDVHDYHNFGNQLLAVNFINTIHEKDEELEFVFLEERASHAKNVIDPQVNATVIYRTINLTREPMSVILKDGIGLETLADCESIVVLGGDCFSANSWHWKWIRYFLFFFFAIRKGKKLFFVSNTIGNFPFYIKLFGKKILQGFKGIYVRDSWSYMQLESIGVDKNIDCMPDLVYMDMPDVDVTVPNKYTVLSPSYLWHKYADSEEKYIDLCCNIYFELAYRLHLPVLIMPHSTSQGARVIAGAIADRVGNGKLVIPNNSSEARKILQGSEMNVCFRMHSALQSIQGNANCVAIGYSEKYEELIEESRLAKPYYVDIARKIQFNYGNTQTSFTDVYQKKIREKLDKLLSQIKEY